MTETGKTSKRTCSKNDIKKNNRLGRRDEWHVFIVIWSRCLVCCTMISEYGSRHCISEKSNVEVWLIF
jgi:hypothetical protein